MSNQGEKNNKITIIGAENPVPKKDWKAKLSAVASSLRDRLGSKTADSDERSITAYRAPALKGELSETEEMSQETYHKYSSRIAKALEKVDDVKQLTESFDNPQPFLNELFFSEGGVAGVDQLKLTGVLKKLIYERLGNLSDKNAFDVAVACEVFMLEKFGVYRMGYASNPISGEEFREVSEKAAQMYQELGFGRFATAFSAVALERINMSRYTDLVRLRNVREEESKDRSEFRLGQLAYEFVQREVTLVKWNNLFSEEYRTQLEEETKKIIEKMKKLGFSDNYIHGNDIRAMLNEAALSVK